MGKGKRLRAEKAAGQLGGRRAPRFSGLAPEPATQPVMGDQTHGRMSSHTRAEIGTSVYGWMLLLPYAEWASTGDALPPALVAARQSAEDDDAYAQRVELGQMMAKAKALADGPAREAAEILATWVPPSSVPGVVAAIATEGLGKLKAAESFELDREAWVVGARPLVGALCPAEHRLAAFDQLDALADSRLEVTEPVAALMAKEPIATVHAAAALVCWLMLQPALVPALNQAVLELTQRAESFLKYT